jgi:hypothetical protein
VINRENITEFLKEFLDLGLQEHYNFEDVLITTLENKADAVNLIKSCNKIVFKFGEENTLYCRVDPSTV